METSDDATTKIDNGEGAERAPTTWTRAVFVVGVTLVLALNATLVGAVLASFAMRQQEGDLYRDRLIALLYAAVWCSSTLAVAAAVVEAWRDRRRSLSCETMSDTADTTHERAVAADAALAARVCNHAYHHKGSGEVVRDIVGAQECAWRVGAWHCTAPGVATFVPTSASGHEPFEARGVPYRVCADDTPRIAQAQTRTASLFSDENNRACGPRFFSGTVEPAGRDQSGIMRDLQTQTVWPTKEDDRIPRCDRTHKPSTLSSKLAFYTDNGGVDCGGCGDGSVRGRGPSFVTADLAMDTLSLAGDSLV